MLKNELINIIQSQKSWLTIIANEIERETKNRFNIISPFAYILTGVRRSGKSTLLRQIMQLHNSENYFNFEDSRTVDFGLRDFHTVEEIFKEMNGSNQFMFFDEIQNVENWERYIRDAVDRGKTIILTGSNAKMLSAELGTKLTGRHLDFEVFPFSFREYLSYRSLNASPETFNQFIFNGGFPGYLQSQNAELLSTLVSDILVRDIFARYNLKNHDAYRKVVQFLLSNTGKEVSFNNLKNSFGIGSATSVMDFLNYLSDSYLIFMIPKYDTSLKVQARNPKKVYGIDQGLVNFSSVSGSPDYGRLLENAVFIELRRRKNETWYFKGKHECDFIYREKQKPLSAMQVTWQLNVQNEERETKGLLEAMNSLKLNESTIITFDQEDEIRIDEKIIHIIPGWKWMSQLPE